MANPLKVGPKLKINVPNFKRTDFSGDIEALGGLSIASSRKARTFPKSSNLSASSQGGKSPKSLAKNKSAEGLEKPEDYDYGGDDLLAGVSRSDPADNSMQSARSADEDDLGKEVFEEWLQSIGKGDTRAKGVPARHATDGAKQRGRADGGVDAARGGGVDADDGGMGIGNIEGIPLETFDSPEEFEEHEPQEWVNICRETPERPQACVLHYAGAEWQMKACWVHDYEEATKRYLVELEDGSMKKVKRLALRFDKEDHRQFALRVETCKAKKAHVELQQRFMSYIDSQNEQLISPMLREYKEKFIRQCLHKSHVNEARNYIGTIRELILEIEQNYMLSMKFSIVKNELIEDNGTLHAHIESESEFALLLQSFLPKPVPFLGLVSHEQADQSVEYIVSQFLKQPIFSKGVYGVTMSVWRRFEEVFKIRILDTSRRGRADAKTARPIGLASEQEPVFEPMEFLKHMEDHRKDVTVTLDRHWRDFIVSEVLDKMSEESNFFIDNQQKHLRSPLHRVLRKLDLILNSQMRWFMQSSIDDWVEFIRSFVPNPSISLPPPLLILNLSTRDGQVVLSPEPEDLIEWIMDLMQGISKVAASIMAVEFELVPFCNLTETLMFEIGDKYQPLLDAKDATKEVIRNCLKGPQEVQAEYQKYAYLLSEELHKELDVLDVEAMRKQIHGYVEAAGEIERLSATVVKFPLFELHCTEIMDTLSQTAYKLADFCLTKVAQSVEERSAKILEEWTATHERILSNPEDEEELANLKQFMSEINKVTTPLISRTKHVHTQIDMLNDFSFEIEAEVVENAFRSFAWPLQIKLDVGESVRSLDTQKLQFMAKLDQEKAEFEHDMKLYQEDLTWITSLGDYSMSLKWAVKINGLKESLDRAKERVQSFVDREKLFNIDVSDYSELDVIIEQFEPFYKLWTTAIEFKYSEDEWLSAPVARLDSEEIDAAVDQWFKDSYKMFKSFDGQQIPQQVAADLREAIEAFKQNMPVIRALCQEAMQPRHWVQLFEEIECDTDMDDALTLQQLLDIGILDHIETVENISAVAQKQFSLKSTLAGMKSEWKPMEFDTVAYKDTGTYLMKGVDEIQVLLDDHIVKTQAVRGSPFVKPIEREVKDWEAKLIYIQDLLEQWLNCQRSWLYLEPIFSSPDIVRQMPTEAKRFQQVDTLWRTTMDAVTENPSALDVSDIENLLQNFIDANKRLDQIQKGLNDYLETKRLAFPRFFFLSNDELLMILSQTKDPTAVQPHMGKCFEGINRVQFDDKNELILSMISVEGEKVDLFNTVNVNEGEKKGNVELWLLEAQGSMIDCLTKVTGSSVKAYADSQRTTWVTEWPGQVVICVDNIYWTQEVASAISKGDMDNYCTVCEKQLLQLVDLVRGDLPKLARKTLTAVVTIDVHNRDVVIDLTKKKIANPAAFDWMAQLRYYWAPKGSITMLDTGKPNEKDECQVSIINATLLYGFEYLGNSDRLVVTPLTDRCYRTLMGAFSLYYGGAPEGPAGTGKTESTKDLAKAMAVMCVVFNCSDGLDYLAMAKFFKGLASSGGWCCFDEFNRINLEVLSVISSQVQTIQKAIKEKKKVFTFEGTELKLIPTCAVNITMNPGYAGRAELPDNLKALFRPCAMMVPDYALIGEIVLYSFGFGEAKLLARKAVGSLRLGSEQLSSQDHYDFGMRALKSILVAAGQLRRRYGNTRSEAILALSALNDVNLPKFTSNDIPLFLGITADLFPGVVLPPSDYGALIAELEGCASKLGLQAKDTFIKKCIQLWETIMVRHGLMMVAQTISGKTAVENVLMKALGEVADGDNYLPVEVHKINPKSITQGQLYGCFDENTHEWTDGVLALTVRYASQAEPTHRQWILLDGPVDAVWIENMNTVLDDNKKLCLNSGEIIKLSMVTTMMFEVEDLTVASPATVSRCGMVYMEQVDIGWKVLLQSWIQRLPQRLQDHAEQITQLFDFVDLGLEMNQRRVKNPVPTSGNWLVMNLLHLYESMIHSELPVEEGTKDINAKEKELKLENLFWWAYIWSIGAGTEQEGRKVIDEFVRMMMAGEGVKDKFSLLNDDAESRPAKQTIPEKGSVYDYYPHDQTNKWTLWTAKIGGFDIPKDAQPHSIIVPTADTVRNAFLLQTLIQREMHVLFSGLTGTGKTVVINSELLRGFDREKYTFIAFAFSAQTSSNMTQDIIDGKLDKRRKGTYGPPLGKRCLIFVDDLNMPTKEEYGAQPPIELLRQWMDTGGWYERKGGDFRSLIDINFIAAMGPPGGGKPFITNRYQRHYNLIFICPFENESLMRIFTTIMSWFLARFPSAIGGLAPSVVKATIDVYESVSKDMRPTPAKSHYTFNLRDLSKVFQGICLCSKPSLAGPDDLIKCWAHECQRVFEDRLVNKEDDKWFMNMLKQTMDANFKRRWDSVVTTEPLIFGDFIDPKKPYYQEMSDHTKLTEVINNLLFDYNQMAKHGMELVLFLAAVQHICRVVRVLKQPLGNVLLVGVGGSGRKSMATLSSFAADYELFQIEISKSYGVADWHDDIKRLLMKAGGHGKEVTFLFSDTQISKETFLEDISNLLNNGEVPNLFNAEDKTQILEFCSKPAVAAGRTGGIADIYAYFTEQCQKNLHVVLALSPIGENFRRRVRMFPSLVNCCTIDWFHEWPDMALRSVANYFLHSVDMSQDVLKGVVEICVEMQKSVFGLTEKFFSEMRRHYYVTPTSYLELINAFKTVLQSKRNEVSRAKNRYDVGLEKLLSTAEQVAKMQAELEELQPVLKKTSAETAELMVTIEQKQKEAAVTQATVEKEEAVTNAQAESARIMKEDCQADLDKALPALNSAMDALKSLKKSDITEVKNLKTPPEGVVTVSKALCWMFDVKPKKVNAPDGRTKLDDYWDPAKKYIWGDAKLMDKLENYDKDNIPVEVMQKIKPLEDDKDFEPEVIKKASVAAFGLCKFVRAMIVYDAVAKVVEPKTKALKKAEAEMNAAMAMLAGKKKELKDVQDMVAGLLRDFDTAKKKKDDLGVQVEECSKRLVRAEKLISGLGGEKSRWTESSHILGGIYANLTGDVLIASGIIAYLGVFLGKYRRETCSQWIDLMHRNKVPASESFELNKVIGDDVVVRQWIIDKLPNDQVSIDNALIQSRSRRWALMIDPQLQANKWTKNTYPELKIVRLSQANYARLLEAAIQFGSPVLIENVGETLDPLLEPLLQKAIFKAGNLSMIRLGDSTIEYHDNFKLFITTKLPNPHYSPEVCVQVTLLNFMVTPDGLEDQMLGILVAKEEPETERKRQNLVVESAQSKAQLKEIEDRILELLSSAKGNILDDEELIDTLSNSKVASQRIEERVNEQEKTQLLIQETRQSYVPVAIRTSALFFTVSDLCQVEPTYQYSLEWFINVFLLAIATAEKFDRNLQKRLVALSSRFVRLLYERVCDSLFERDKLMFSLLLTFKVMEVDQDIDDDEKKLLLLCGGGGGVHSKPKPNASWLTDISWGRVLELEKLDRGPFKAFSTTFANTIDGWKTVFDSDTPNEDAWPGGIKEKCTNLEKALVMLAVRTDCTVPAIQETIAGKLGKEFLEPPAFNLEASYNDSNNCMPLIFVLSTGADPMNEVQRLGVKVGMNEKQAAISLGQGQGPRAEKAVKEGIEGGLWVILQNCHLAVSWLPKLEHICEELNPDTTHDQFRLWLTAMPSKEFPVSVLQNGLKMTIEPPKGLKQNLLRAYLQFDTEWFEDACKSKQNEFRKLLFGLCFFHALIQERRKYGPLGWNIQYEFSEPDRQICTAQLEQFVNEADNAADIPWNALRYTAAEANYGGRVTDVHDRRTIAMILTDFYCPEIVKDDYKFSVSGIYYAPEFTSFGGYVEFIRNLPLNERPEVFWLHNNANLTAAISECMKVLSTANVLQPRIGGGGGKSTDEILAESSEELLSMLPEVFDIEYVSHKYQTDYHESMNTVLNQELLRFNKLLGRIRESLVDIGKMVKGLVLMSPDLEQLMNGMMTNMQPAFWKKVSFPSLKPLKSYCLDLQARLLFLQNWIDNGAPIEFWLSGFFFTQSFLTGQLQNFARKYSLPIDTLIWNYKVLKFVKPNCGLVEKPKDGCLNYGLFIDGARWDDEAGAIGESIPKVLFSEVPHILMVPVENDKDKTNPNEIYPCPLYKTSERKGVLSTTGHSTNFVMTVLFPISKQHSEKFWTRRGVAALTQLDD